MTISLTPQEVESLRSFTSTVPQEDPHPTYDHYNSRLCPNLPAISALYHLGLNVFPQPYGWKKGFPWGQFQYQRLRESDLPSVFAGTCNVAIMMGKTSRNLFVIDCETEESLLFHMYKVKEKGWPLWVVKTSRGGHIYFLSADGEIKSVAPKTIPDIEIRGNSGYVLCPPSLHPAGTFYSWLYQEGPEPPTVSLRDVDWLETVEGKSVFLKMSWMRNAVSQDRWKTVASQVGAPDDPRFSRLSKATLNYLNSSFTPRGSRNDLLFKAACDMAGCEFSEAEAHEMLTPVPDNSGLELSAISRTIKSAYGKPRTSSRSHEQTTIITTSTQDWQYMLAYVQHQQWMGQTGITDRQVMLALIERSKCINEQDVFRASEREIAKLARRGRLTVRKSLKRLQERGWVHKVNAKDHLSEANLWRFDDKIIREGKSWKNDPLLSLPEVELNGSLLYKFGAKTTDAAERGALGVTGVTVYLTMRALGRIVTTQELVVETGYTINQVNTARRKLVTYELVAAAGWGKWKVIRKVDDIRELDELVALPAGKLGRGERREAEFSDERAKYVAERIMLWRARRDRANFPLRLWRCSSCHRTSWHNEDVRIPICPRCHVHKEPSFHPSEDGDFRTVLNDDGQQEGAAFLAEESDQNRIDNYDSEGVENRGIALTNAPATG